jgi:hypothetical protein
VSWDRDPAAKALAAALTDVVAAQQLAVTVFDRPPPSLNPPALVVAWPIEVRFSAAAFGIDEVTLPVLCVGPVDGEDTVAELIAVVRDAELDPSLGGAVQIAYPSMERNWRQINVAGVDLLSAEVTYTIQM